MRVLILFFLLSCATRSVAQDLFLYHVDSNRQVHSPRSNTFILTENGKAISDEAVLSGNLDGEFMPYEKADRETKSSTYWLRIRLLANQSINNWHLLLRDEKEAMGYTAQNDYVDAWFKQGHGQQKFRSGTMTPRAEKSIDTVAGYNAVPLSLKAGDTVTAYIKVKNLFYEKPGFSFLEIVDPTAGVGTQQSLAWMFLLLNATALIFCIISFFFYYFIREKAYLFFALYTLVLSQHYLILHPDMPFIDRFIPGQPQLVYGFWTMLTVGSFVLFCLFGKFFINLQTLSPRLNKWFNWFIAALAASVLLTAAGRMIWLTDIIPNIVTYILLVVMLGFIVRFAFFKSVLAKFFVAGAACLFVFTVMGLAYNAKVISLPFNPWPLGQVGQLLIYAAGLAYKVRLNEKLRAEANRIREMDSIKSKFFANISHEFRTPLTLIQGPLQQIEEELGAASVESNKPALVPIRHIRTMRRNTDRLLELVNQLLDLSRLDAGSMRLQVIKGDVLQLLKAIAYSFESMAERKNIHYHIHFPEHTVVSFFDKDKLEKIFTNLLGNAFKYTPEQGTVAVTISADDNRLRLVVEDNGPGIPKKELDKVFDRFYQVEGTEDKGSGIGLALVKELVELYRGQVSVSSEPSKGSRFRVSLPFNKNDFKENEFIYGEYKVDAAIHHTAPAPGEDLKSNTSINAHLPLALIVEDNADLRAFIEETIVGNYQVEKATNGAEGLEKAITLVPDIIVSDVMMPLMDGFAMTEKLKKDERTSHIPVILLTAKAGQAHKIEGLETGADDYLTKPFDAKELLTRLENLVNQRRLLRKKFAGVIQLKPSEVSVKSLDEQFLSNIMQAIEKNMEEDEFGVEELAREVAMSRSQLHRKLNALLGKSPSDLIRQTRLLRAKELLEKKALTPSEVAFKVGFNSHTYFSKCFKDEFGMSPSEVA
jgi:signal transduction histidine kinase/DNA-binding response OmpR family regulator